MSVWDVFTPEPYTFLKLKQASEGNTVEEEYEAEGVFKLRGGMTQSNNIESPTADASLRVKPDEEFVNNLSADLVGHGIRVARGDNTSLDYRIIGQTEGYDYDNQMDFYLLELKREHLWEPSGLPLE
jgi:hypothetical protein